MSYERVPSPTQNPPGIVSITVRSLKVRFNSLREPFSYDKHDNAVTIPYLALFMALSIPFSVLIFNRVMHFGHPVEFPLSDARSGWMEGPSTRGSINIVWSCFSTIFTCVYVSLHLDVPFTAGDIRPGLTAKFKAFLRTIGRKGGWIIFNILAPELIVQVAITEYLSAKIGERKIADKRWTLSHAFFADMGGFKIQVDPQGSSVSVQDNGSNQESEHMMNANALEENSSLREKEVDPEYVVLQSGGDFYRWIDTHNKHSEIKFKQLGLEIQGASKADWLLKTLTCIQAAWLVVQTVVRVIKGRPVSELEVTTCSYVVCALITYVFWWKKPYGVQTHIDLRVHATQGPDWEQDTDLTPYNRTIRDDWSSVLVAPIVGTVIGAIHCTLWNATFVNSSGQLLWRICCITQICAPFCSLLFGTAIAALVLLVSLLPHCKWIEDYAIIVLWSVAGFVLFLYFIARIVLFILIGYSFWSLPAGVYTDVDWSWSWFPHWH